MASTYIGDGTGPTVTTGPSYFGDQTPLLSALAALNGAVWTLAATQVGSGVISRAGPWGASLVTTSSTGFGTPSVGTCTFDLTGGAYENLLTVVPIGGWTFSAADKGKSITITSGAKLGALAKIEEVIDANNVTLETCAWDADLAAGTGLLLIHEPISFTGNGLKVNNISAGGEWENYAPAHTYKYATKFETSMAAANVTNVRMVTNALGYTNSDTLQILHVVDGLAAGGLQKVVRITADDSTCVGGATTEIDAIKLNRIKGASTATATALNVGTEFTNALVVNGSPPINPGYGYSFTNLFAVTDRVNSGGGGNDAFINAATNVQIFTADNYGILIGSDNTFSVIEAILSIAASATITPTWQYSTGDGTWAALTVSDTTGGFARSGKISFTPPVGWAKSAHCDGVTGAVTNALYIRIIRTKNSLAVPPTESFFKVFAGEPLSDGMTIRGDGSIKPAQMTDATAVNDSLYLSLTSGVLSYKDSGGVVHGLW